MEFDDRIYGKQKVEKEAIKELIETRPMKRLKHVHQAGPSPFFMEDKPPVTRFEHSLGVFFLLKNHDASVEEQVAGLIHDIPHTAFSHVADFVFENEGHEYHEKFLDEIIYSSDIPEILESHGLDVDYVLDEDNFRLLERDLPKLCADRLDYSMRDLKAHKDYDMESFADNLTVKDEEFVFQSKEKAVEFGEKFIEADNSFWAHPKEVAIYEIFSDIIRKALKLDRIQEEDLFNTDEQLMEKLREIEDKEIQEKFDLLDSGIEIEVGKEDYDILGTTKARAVDPSFLENGEKVQASKRSEKLKNSIQQHNQKVEEGYKIKILN